MKILILFCWITSIVFAGVFFVRALARALRDDSTIKIRRRKIEIGSKVSLCFTLKDMNGAVLVNSFRDKPLVYTHGDGQIVAGLEKRLRGVKEGARKTIFVPAKEAYGKPNPEEIVEVPKDSVPEEAVETEAIIKGIGKDEKSCRIVEIRDETLLVDYNNPLAGKDLVFELEVIKVDE